MNQYFLILIWVLFMGLFTTRQQYTYIENDELITTKPSKLYCIFLVLPLIISAAFRTTFGDQGYKIAFRAATGTDSLGQLISTIQGGAKGPGYYVLQFLGNTIFGYNAELFFFVVAAFQMFALIRLYRKYSVNLWVAIFVFVASTDYLSWMQNGIRQFIAVSIILLFSDWIFEKKLIRMCMVILVAATVHTSSLIMIPILFIIQGKAFNKKTFLAMVGTVGVIFTLARLVPFLDTILSGTEYSGAISDWQNSGNDGVNWLRVAVYSMPVFLSFVGARSIKNSEDNVIHITCNMGIISTLIYIIGAFTSGIYIGRLPIYLSLYSNGILLPWLLKNAFNQETKKILYVLMIMFYIIFYWYQTHMVWGII